MEQENLKLILESLIMASSRPISINRMLEVFEENKQPERKAVQQALTALAEDYQDKSVELKEVSTGYRFQVRKDYASWVSKLWEEKPARYSRALLETLALVAYKQPITRGEIEKIRGVSVGSQIMKTLLEREWVHVVGHRDVPGKPAIYATTKQFLDYFNLKSLEDLPPLADIKDLDKLAGQLDLPEPEQAEHKASDDEVQASNEDAQAAQSAAEEVTLDVAVEAESQAEDVELAKAVTAE